MAEAVEDEEEEIVEEKEKAEVKADHIKENLVQAEIKEIEKRVLTNDPKNPSAIPIDQLSNLKGSRKK